jgi:hypothetical protein
MSTDVQVQNSGTNFATLRPYKAYTANIVQQRFSQTNGVLVVGKTYRIVEVLGDDDFSNVGYEGGDFVATGTTPTKWTNSSVVINITDSAPQATVLENTLTASVWQWNNEGSYYIDTDTDFDETKNYCAGFGDWGDLGVSGFPLLDENNLVGGYYFITFRDNSGKLTIQLRVITSTGQANNKDLFDIIGTTVLYLPEIRVYS